MAEDENRAISVPLGTPSPAIERLLSGATTRVRQIRARRFGAIGLLYGSGVTVLGAVASHLFPLVSDTLDTEWWLLPPLLGLTLGAIWGTTRPVPALPLLRLLEQSLDLKERLSTANAPARDASTLAEAFAHQQRLDAEAAANQSHDLKKILPLWPPTKREVASLVAAVGASLLIFLPDLPLFQSPGERTERAAVKKEGERIVRIAHALEKRAGEKKLEGAKRAAQQMVKLGEEMKKGRLNRQKAMMKVAKLSNEMRQAQQNAATQTSPKSLSRAAREFGKALTPPENGKPGDTARNENLTAPQNPSGKKSPSASSPTAESLKPIQQALAENNSSSLVEQLSRLADQTAEGKPGDAATRRELSEKLDALAKSLEGTRLERASEPLKQAANALKSGDLSRTSEKLRDAARRIAESAKQESESSELQKMAEALSGNQSGSGEGEMSDAGEGTGKDDAFSKEGVRKGHHVHTKECLQPGGT